jgi:hypothetical protein
VARTYLTTAKRRSTGQEHRKRETTAPARRGRPEAARREKEERGKLQGTGLPWHRRVYRPRMLMRLDGSSKQRAFSRHGATMARGSARGGEESGATNCVGERWGRRWFWLWNFRHGSVDVHADYGGSSSGR